MQVNFFKHDLGADQLQAIAKVIESPFLTSGPVGRAVEAQLCQYFGVRRSALVNSWTNGAIAVLLALGVGPGDEVIVPAQTFIASANVVELLGAKAVFVDVDPTTLLVTPAAVAAAVTPRTKAVIPVHLYGQMVDIAALREALPARVSIIEDCAHCFEGEINGRKPGADSTCAIFSFYATKNVTCGEGGAIITNDESLHDLILQTRLHGMSASAMDRFKTGGYRHWDMARMGMKANLPDLLACLLPHQIEQIDAKLSRREDICRYYERAFEALPIRVPAPIGNAKHARHLFVIHVDPAVRDQALTHFGTKGVGVTVNYRSVPMTTFYREKHGYKEADFPVSQNWGAGTITLPLHHHLTREEQDYVIDVVRRDIVPMIEAAAPRRSVA